MKSEISYIQFPLFLVKGIFHKREAVINNIIDYGVYRCSQIFEFKRKAEDVARQLIHDIYYDNIGDEWKQYFSLPEHSTIGREKKYSERKYALDEFEPANEIEELMGLFESDKNLYKMAVNRYLVHSALKSLELSRDITQVLKTGKEIESLIPEKEPMPMLSTKLLLKYCNARKSEFEIAQLLAYMAVKSVLGTKPYAKSNKKHIVSRMFGYSSCAQSKNCKSALYKKYSKRYHIDHVLQHLELEWQLKLYSNHNRGFYLAIGNKVSIETLANKAESRKLKNRISELLRKKAEVRKNATLQLQLN